MSKVVNSALNKFGDKEYINPNTQLRTDLHLSNKPLHQILEFANLQTPPPPPPKSAVKKQKNELRI